MEKILYLVRGVSGSGKTTLAKSLGVPVYSADNYFMEYGEYKFDLSKLPDAHDDCKSRVLFAMQYGEKIAVANTFCREWEMDDYFAMAEENGYTVFSLVVENRHGSTNDHGVPEDKVQEMRDRFEVKL